MTRGSGTHGVATLALTSGEPAGVGPDLCAALLDQRWPCRIVLLGDRSLFGRSRPLPAIPDYDPSAPVRRRIELLHLPLRVASRPGRLDPRNAPYVIEQLNRAADGCLAGEFAGMVTAPVHKGLINEAGLPFTGHTEYLARRCGAGMPVMMLVGGGLRVALVTTHLPLSEVSSAITAQRIETVLVTLHRGLRRQFGLARPRVLVCGLNPHAGEGGHLGREEMDVIEPVLKRLRRRGIASTGPVPADTAFLPRTLAGHDAVLAMYHDQGLPVLKAASFGHAVNLTLGLPIIRSSVDHGTALDLAGTDRADPGSLVAAIRLAAELAARRSPAHR